MGVRDFGKSVKHANKKKKAKDDGGPTDGQNGAAESIQAARKALKTAKGVEKGHRGFISTTNHHCPECGAAYNNNTCTKKGHKIMCAAHNMLYYRKGRCWRCANDTRDVDKQELAASEARRKDAEAALLKANDFQNSPPEKKKPKRDKN